MGRGRERWVAAAMAFGVVRAVDDVSARLDAPVSGVIGPNGRIDVVLTTFPQLTALLDRRAGLLSGGEQQMVAIGQALVCRPQVLVIDEMSLGPALIVVDRLLRVLGALAADGIAVLLIAQFTDKVLAVAATAHVMSGGVVAFSGPAATLASSPEIIHAAYLGVRTAPARGASHA